MENVFHTQKKDASCKRDQRWAARWFWLSTFLFFYYTIYLFTFIDGGKSTCQQAFSLSLSISPLICYILLSTHSETVGDWIEAQQLGRKRLPPTRRPFPPHARLHWKPFYTFMGGRNVTSESIPLIFLFMFYSPSIDLSFIYGRYIAVYSASLVRSIGAGRGLDQMERQRLYFSFAVIESRLREGNAVCV